MKTVSISGSLRENVGKKDAKKVRLQEGVPCVIYGGGKQIHFYVNKKELNTLFTTPEICYVELELGGEKHLSIVQDAQFHKVKDTLLHVDFFEINDSRPIIMAVPLNIVGSSQGVLKGGRLVKTARKLRVKALPANMPENITVDISKLEIGDEIRVKDLAVGSYEFMEMAAKTVIIIKTTRNVAEEESAAETVAVEEVVATES